jgi:hypothetical protein
MRSSFLFLWLAFLCAVQVFGATMVAPTACEPPKWLVAPVPGLTACECVDFAGDGVLDFIAMGPAPSATSSGDAAPLLGIEAWDTSDRRVVARIPAHASDYRFRWFARLSSRKQSDIISAFGFSEGIDYTLERLNLVTGRLEVLFYFQPILVEADGKMYHGYPWDLGDILTFTSGKERTLRASVGPPPPPNDEALSMGFQDNAGMPASQRKVPHLFFSGRSTQPDLAALPHQPSRRCLLSDLIRASRGQ